MRELLQLALVQLLLVQLLLLFHLAYVHGHVGEEVVGRHGNWTIDRDVREVLS